MRCCVALPLLSLTLVTLAIHSCSGQGLKTVQRSPVSASQVANTFNLRQQYLEIQRIRQQKPSMLFKSSCRNGRPGTVCAGMSDSNTSRSDAQTLLVAASPELYSSLDMTFTGGVSLVSPPGDQGDCHTCAAFAVTSAAETAMASVLGVDVANCSISVQALHFCAPGQEGRECEGGWPLKATTLRLIRSWPLPTKDCLEYNPTPAQLSLNRARVCMPKCGLISPYANQGGFDYDEITTWVTAQQHIRQYGGVVSTFDVVTGFRSFFKDPANRNSVFRPSPGAVSEEDHAVVLVGYNNKEQYWVVKNSWGTDQGDGGYFKVAYNTCSIMTGDKWEAYGLIWKPRDPQLKGPVVKLTKSLSRGPRAGCYQHTVRSGDYLSKISWLANVTLEQLLRDNDGVLANFTPPEGTKLLICNPNAISQTGGRRLGCYADYARAMEGFFRGRNVSGTEEGHVNYLVPALVGDTVTVDACANLARKEGYKYFGLQTGDQCWLSKDLTKQLKCPEVPGDCNKPCIGNPTQICGNWATNSVYMLESKGAIGVPAYSYVGCYRDHCSAIRALPEVQYDDTITPEKCAEHALRAGHSIYGLQAGRECWHGPNLSHATRYGKVDEAVCNFQCARAESLDCGGHWANTLYTLDP